MKNDPRPNEIFNKKVHRKIPDNWVSLIYNLVGGARSVRRALLLRMCAQMLIKIRINI